MNMTTCCEPEAKYPPFSHEPADPPVTIYAEPVQIQAKCKDCGKLIFTETEADPSHTFVRQLLPMLVCDECADTRIEKRKREEGLTRADEWKAVCPPEFRKCDPHRLPLPSKLDRVLQWKFNPKGLLLVGPTGRGKSRCAWSLCQREFFTGRGVAVIDCLFAMEYTKRIGVSGQKAMQWIEYLMHAPLLLMDDVFKVKLDNSGAEAALFGLVNERTQYRRPIIVTAQDDPETLKARMSTDRGAAIVRRLTEYCEAISFA